MSWDRAVRYVMEPDTFTSTRWLDLPVLRWRSNAARSTVDAALPRKSRRPLMRASRLLVTLASGAAANVEFSDALRLAEALGFEELRISGSHHVLARRGIPEQLDLQDRRGQAKPYQLRQLMSLVQRYDLKIEEDR